MTTTAAAVHLLLLFTPVCFAGIGSSCKDNASCDILHSECDPVLKKCRCPPGMTTSLDGTFCYDGIWICSADNQCPPQFPKCIRNTCSCSVGVEKDGSCSRDLCKPSPCGPHSECRVSNGKSVCTCLPTYLGNPPNCRPECVSNFECAADKACINQRCKDPCACGRNAQCENVAHDPVCRCVSGHAGDPYDGCSPLSTQCPPLLLTSRDIECTQDGKRVDCSKPMVPGTRAAVKCNTHYTQIREFATADTVCQDGGRWSQDIVPCKPICGVPNADGVPLVYKGFEIKKGEYPWHAAIYRQESHGSMELICGGSIVSPREIVSAAHCFFDEGSAKPKDNGIFRVVVGMYYREWNRSSNYSQIKQIDKIVLHDRYSGHSTFHESDIAVIITKEEIKMTVAVKPVCVDYDKTYVNLFVPQVTGLVLGLGATENNTISDRLRAVILPYISYPECRKQVPSNFLTFLTHDKFCAGYDNGTTVCQGDSGGGYSVKVEEKYYLTGIVSVGTDTDCSLSKYVTFTKVSDYLLFIRNYAE